jgi:hypothetical protein
MNKNYELLIVNQEDTKTLFLWKGFSSSYKELVNLFSIKCACYIVLLKKVIDRIELDEVDFDLKFYHNHSRQRNS